MTSEKTSEVAGQVATIQEDFAVATQDEARVNQLVAEIDISAPAAVMAYGAKPMGEIARFSDSLLEQIKAKDAGEVGQLLSNLLMHVRENDPLSADEKSSGFLARLPVIGSLFKQVEQRRIDHKTVTAQVEDITEHLDGSMVKLLRDVEVLEQLYQRNLAFYKEVDLYVDAGKQKLRLTQEQDLPVLRQQAETSGDMMDAQKVKDMLENINRFERRIHDLELSKTIALQTAPQIRMVQSNNQQLAEKIQSSIMTTLPVWKSQMVLAMTLDAQKKAAHLQKQVADTTNELLRKNAEVLQQSSIATANEVERSIVDIDTLRDVQSKLVNTIEETLRIATEGRARRAEAEQELRSMEDNLRQRLLAASSSTKQA